MESKNVFSSPEPKAPGGGAYSIGRLPRPSVHNFKWLLLWNYWTDCNQISYTASRYFKKEKKYSNGLGHMTNMAAMPIYGKKLKNLLQNQ